MLTFDMLVIPAWHAVHDRSVWLLLVNSMTASMWHAIWLLRYNDRQLRDYYAIVITLLIHTVGKASVCTVYETSIDCWKVRRVLATVFRKLPETQTWYLNTQYTYIGTSVFFMVHIKSPAALHVDNQLQNIIKTRRTIFEISPDREERSRRESICRVSWLGRCRQNRLSLAWWERSRSNPKSIQHCRGPHLNSQSKDLHYFPTARSIHHETLDDTRSALKAKTSKCSKIKSTTLMLTILKNNIYKQQNRKRFATANRIF